VRDHNASRLVCQDPASSASPPGMSTWLVGSSIR
jgi:hypothetical protein